MTHVRYSVLVWKMDQRVTIGETFLTLSLDKSVRILDVACGAGAVAEELVQRGYTNIDGLDSMKGYLEVAQDKKLYSNTYHLAVEPDKKLPIPDQSYDVLLCCAGFFQGLMSPRVFPELIRITKKGGVLIWNIAEGYEDYPGDFQYYDQIIDELRSSKHWEYLSPRQEMNRIVFTDSGASYLGGYSDVGLDTRGYIYTMTRL